MATMMHMLFRSPNDLDNGLLVGVFTTEGLARSYASQMVEHWKADAAAIRVIPVLLDPEFHATPVAPEDARIAPGA